MSAPSQNLTDDAIQKNFRAVFGWDGPSVSWLRGVVLAPLFAAPYGLWTAEVIRDFRERCGVFDLPEGWRCWEDEGAPVFDSDYIWVLVDPPGQGSMVAFGNLDKTADGLTADQAEELATVLQIAAREARRRSADAKAAGVLVEGEAPP